MIDCEYGGYLSPWAAAHLVHWCYLHSCMYVCIFGDNCGNFKHASVIRHHCLCMRRCRAPIAKTRRKQRNSKAIAPNHHKCQWQTVLSIVCNLPKFWLMNGLMYNIYFIITLEVWYVYEWSLATSHKHKHYVETIKENTQQPLAAKHLL